MTSLNSISPVFLIPARAGSKRVVNKNLRPIKGIPLISRTISCAFKSGAKSVFVSTDSDDIATISSISGAEVIRRPPEYAGDSSRVEESILHALSVIPTASDYTHVVLLQVTSPFRTSSNIVNCLLKAENNPQVDCILTCHQNKEDFWLINNHQPTRLFPDAPRRQQDRDPLFVENGCVYVSRIDSLKSTNSILGRNQLLVESTVIEGFDINTELDMICAEAIASSGLC